MGAAFVTHLTAINRSDSRRRSSTFSIEDTKAFTPEGQRRGNRRKAIMAKTVNKVFLLGNVGKDPEIRSTTGGTLVANLSLATSDRYKDKGGEWQERTEWHNLVGYARGAEILRDYVKKGSKLYVEGRITTRSWDDKETGKKAYRTEIVVNEISLLSPVEGSTGRSASNGRDSQSRTNRYSEPADDFGSVGITDDDIPF
jgi:single-strand DNA-binding protein